MNTRYASLPKPRTRLDRETSFVAWVYGARIEKLTERTVAELARDYGVSAGFVEMHLARRMGE